MNTELVVVKGFFQRHADLSKPVLLGISGGPDSLALLRLAKECQKFFPLKLGIAHVDHGWRMESKEEAKRLESLASSLDVPFHLKTLSPDDAVGNLEAHCREERLAFFERLCSHEGYQAVMLAHHADDIAETVLKRLFEGASFTCMAGMAPVVRIGRLSVWRPLLSLAKKKLDFYAHSFLVAPVDDWTNSDPSFLRGRMRTRLIPDLSSAFGKEVGGPLQRLSVEALELADYLDGQISPVIRRMQKGRVGALLETFAGELSHTIEWKHLLRRFCEQAGFALSFAALQDACRALITRSADKRFEANGRLLYVDRGRVFSLGRLLDACMWNVESRTEIYQGQKAVIGWQALWQGEGEVFLPVADYTVAPAAANEPYPRSSPLGKLWTDSRVPAFLRRTVPVVWEGGKISFEFLSGRHVPPLKIGQEVLRLSIRFVGDIPIAGETSDMVRLGFESRIT